MFYFAIYISDLQENVWGFRNGAFVTQEKRSKR